jgi:hypothetical protein
MTKWTDWITHDGSAECPVPEGVRFQWCFGQFPAVRYDSGRNGPPYWADVTRYRTRLPGKKARIKELEARVETLSRLDREAATYVESEICMRTDFTGDPPYVGWKGLGLAMVEKFDADKALIAELEAQLKEAATLLSRLESDMHPIRYVCDEWTSNIIKSFLENLK